MEKYADYAVIYSLFVIASSDFVDTFLTDTFPSLQSNRFVSLLVRGALFLGLYILYKYFVPDKPSTGSV